MKKKKRIKRKQKPRAEKCPFCEKKTTPDYKNYKELENFLSERAKILSSDITGVCSRHQRILAKSVKRARHLGLLPFVLKVR